VTRHVFPLPVMLTGAIRGKTADGNGPVVMHVNGNFRAEQTFPVTENFADAEFLVGGNRPECDIPG
jgi:hypothetical protein